MQEPNPPPTKADQLTYEQFLTYVQNLEGRFEYVDGQAVPLYDMGQPSDAHQDLAFALGKRLDAHFEGSDCRVRLAGTLRTGKQEKSPDRCPDLLVICDGKPRRLVCEIMSPNRGDDLGKKRDEYEAMPEFEEYLLVDSIAHWVRVFRRDTNGLFVYDVDHIAGPVRLHSIGYTLDIDALYRDAGVR